MGAGSGAAVVTRLQSSWKVLPGSGETWKRTPCIAVRAVTLLNGRWCSTSSTESATAARAAAAASVAMARSRPPWRATAPRR
eukprot:4832735-Prymnesium_polylepis.1